MWEHNVSRNNPTNVVAPANFFVWREEKDVFEELAAVTWFSQALTGTEMPERVGAMAVNANFFPLLGVRPHLGRFFLPEEDDPTSTARPAVLSYAFWTQRFGAEENGSGSRTTSGSTRGSSALCTTSSWSHFRLTTPKNW